MCKHVQGNLLVQMNSRANVQPGLSLLPTSPPTEDFGNTAVLT